MRIKKDTTPKNQLGVLGKVKVGAKAKNANGKEYPTSLDHFRFTSKQVSRVERIKALLGDKPTSIPITFHSNEINEVCSQRYEIRDKGGRLVAYGDGATDFMESTAKGWDACNKERFKALTAVNGNTWKEILILKFVILGYPEIGVWELRTGGKDTSIQQITSTFDLVLEQAGRVTMIPFNLTVQKSKSNRANVNRQYTVINLIPDSGLEKLNKIKELGDGLSGLLTADAIEQAALPSANNDTITSTEGYSVFTDFEEVE